MRYTFHLYTPDQGLFAVDNDRVCDHVADLIGEIRDAQHDMPVCYVWSATLGRRITAALNAQHDAINQPNTTRLF